MNGASPRPKVSRLTKADIDRIEIPQCSGLLPCRMACYPLVGLASGRQRDGVVSLNAVKAIKQRSAL